MMNDKKVIRIDAFFDDADDGGELAELAIDVENDRKYHTILKTPSTIEETAFKLRQLAASIERHNS